MNTPGKQTMLALSGVRALLHEVHALMAEASRILDRHGWVDASPSRKASHLSNAWDRPQDWLPKYLYRWYKSPAHSTTLLAMAVHLFEEDGSPPQPWVVLGAYVDTDLEDGLTTTAAETYSAGLHVEGEEATASGTIIRLTLDRGRRLSLAVPLVEIDSAETLQQRVVAPVLGALTSAAK